MNSSSQVKPRFSKVTFKKFRLENYSIKSQLKSLKLQNLGFTQFKHGLFFCEGRLVVKMKKSYYGLKSFLRHKGRKHFCKGETLTSMLNRMAFQQVPYEKLSQRTFSFLIRLPPSIYLRHSYDEEDNSNRLHNVHTSSTFEQLHPTIHLKPKI